MSPDSLKSPPLGPVPARLPSTEAQRLKALHESGVLDTPPEPAFDDLTQLASTICGTPMALVSLVDRDRQWFKSRVGVDLEQTPRDVSFCAHALLEPDHVFEVPDTAVDARFAGNPFVTSDPRIRFYASAPILSVENLPLGSLCVFDQHPRRLTPSQQAALSALARTAGELLQARRVAADMHKADGELRAMFEQTHAGIVVTDTAGHLMRVNERFCQIVGRSREELLAHTGLELTHPDDREYNRTLTERMFATGEPYTLEKRYVRGDGSVAWVRNQVSAMTDAQGRVVAAITAVEDIGEQRRMENRIRESEERFIAMAQSAPLKMWMTDATGGCTFINRHWCDYVGQPMSTQLGVGWADAVEMEDGRPAIQVFAEAAADRGIFRREYRLRRHDGVRRWHVSSATPRFSDEGEFLGYIGSIVDIHDEREARAAIERLASERGAMLDGMVECMPSGVIAVDMTGRVLVHNSAAGQISRQPEGMQPVHCTDWTAGLRLENGDGTPLLYDRIPLLRALAGETVKDFEMRMIHPGRGLDTIVSASAQPLVGPDGRPSGAVVVFDDISERKHAERALSQSEALFRGMSESNPHQVWTADAHGNIDFINGVALRYYGLQRDELAGDRWMDIVHPDDRPEMAKIWDRSLRTGEVHHTQTRMRRHDGVYRWHITQAVPQLDADGQPQRWFGSTVDVEDLRRAQAAAESAGEAKTQFLANMSHEIRTPMNGVIGMTTLLAGTALDKAQREYVETIRGSGEHLLAVINDILDFSKAEAGKLDLEHYAFGLRGCIEDALELVAGAADQKGLELVLDLSADIPAQVIGDAGRLRQVLANLLSNAIKFTPRGEVVVTATRVSRSADGLHERLQFAVRDSGIGIPADRMDRLFGVFSQVDASHTRTYGGSGLGLATCKRLVERMNGRIWAHSEDGRGSTFSFEIEFEAAPAAQELSRSPSLGVHRVLLVDDHPVNRRVLGLMLQSWGLAVDEAAHPDEALALARQSQYDVALVDFQMPGMTGVELARALRASPASSGLPMILLGSVSGANTADEQALFAARMLKPVRTSTLFDQLALLFGGVRAAGRRTETVDRELGRWHPLRILVAEDNTVNQKVALHLLERLGYGADLVSNGLEAVAAVERQTYDVVLMDVQMPEMDGFDATRAIRRQVNDGPRIIAVTANAMVGDDQRCFDAGMDDYIRKPIDLRELVDALKRSKPRWAQPSVAMIGPASGPSPARSALKSSVRPMSQPPDSEAPDFRDDMLEPLVSMYEAEGATELVQTMRDDLPRQRAELAAALDRQDRTSCSRVAHSLKSEVRMVSADALGHALERAERDFRDGDLGAAVAAMPALLERCATLFEKLCEAANA